MTHGKRWAAVLVGHDGQLMKYLPITFIIVLFLRSSYLVVNL